MFSDVADGNHWDSKVLDIIYICDKYIKTQDINKLKIGRENNYYIVTNLLH